MQMTVFWNWKKTNNESVRELVMDGVIAENSWLDDEVTPQLFKSQLDEGDGPIIIWLNSPGGDCIAASQIYTMLMNYPNEVTVRVDGLAASAASVIAMAGTTVEMAPTSLMMIHNPLTAVMGSSKEMSRAIVMLEEVKESIINAYELKTDLTREELSKMMDAETWMNANKAKELGFCDAIYQGDKELAPSNYSFSTKQLALEFVAKLETKYTPIQSFYDRLERLKY